jgi:hypothetical protein
MIDGVLYCNDGDWVESRSALVEHVDGRLELIYWDQSLESIPVAQSLTHLPEPVVVATIAEVA